MGLAPGTRGEGGGGEGRGDRGRGGDWGRGGRTGARGASLQGVGGARRGSGGYREGGMGRGGPGGPSGGGDRGGGRGPGRSAWDQGGSGGSSFSSDRGRGRPPPPQEGFSGGVDGFREWQEKRAAGREAQAGSPPGSPGLSSSGERWRQGERPSSRDRGPGQSAWDVGRGAGQSWDRAEAQRGDRAGSAWGSRTPQREWGAEEGEGADNWEASRESTGSGVGGVPAVMGEVLYGVAPVQAALRAGKREVFTLYVQEGLEEGIKGGRRKDKQAAFWLLREARARGISLEPASEHTLNLLAGNRPHQGFILDAEPLGLESIDCLPPISLAAGSEGTGGAPGRAVWPPLWVALDQVTDPQNLGAILRSALFLGAAGVVVCEKNSAPLSAVVAKASAGALEAIPVFLCRSMTKFLAQSAANGWLTVGAAAEREAVPVRQLAADTQGVPLLLVLGSEGAGLRTVVRRACSELVRIDNLAGPGPGAPHRREEVRGGVDGGEEGLEEEDASGDTHCWKCMDGCSGG